GLNHQLLDIGDEVDDVAVEILRQRDSHRRLVFGHSAGGADEVVDREGDTARGGEVGVLEGETEATLGAQGETDLALDETARGDTAGGGHTGDDGGRITGSLEAVDG